MKWNPTLYQNKHAFVFNYGESLIELLDPKQHERILDLGCGTGELTAQIANICPNVIGMDLSADMIQQARLDYPGVRFEVGDAANFHFEDGFHAIFSNAALHWVTNYRGAIKCMHHNLREGGRIVIEFGGKGNVKSIVQSLKSCLQLKGYAKQAEVNPWYFPSIGEYTSELEKVGFRVTYAIHYDRPTLLADRENGVVDWIKMFGKMFFKEVSAVDIEDISRQVQEMLRPKLFREGEWFADYKRIRIVAYKEG